MNNCVCCCSDATVGSFCELLEDFCGRAEIPIDDRDEAEWLSLPLSDLRMLVNEIMSIRSKKLLHLVPVDILVRLLKVLDHQIHRAEGLSIDECEHVSLLSISFVLHCLRVVIFFLFQDVYIVSLLHPLFGY